MNLIKIIKRLTRKIKCFFGFHWYFKTVVYRLGYPSPIGEYQVCLGCYKKIDVKCFYPGIEEEEIINESN